MDDEMDVEKTFIATKTPDTYGCGEGYSLRFNHKDKDKDKDKWRTLSFGKFNNVWEIQDDFDLPNMIWKRTKTYTEAKQKLGNVDFQEAINVKVENSRDDFEFGIGIQNPDHIIVSLNIWKDKNHVFYLAAAEAEAAAQQQQ